MTAAPPNPATAIGVLALRVKGSPELDGAMVGMGFARWLDEHFPSGGADSIGHQFWFFFAIFVVFLVLVACFSVRARKFILRVEFPAALASALALTLAIWPGLVVSGWFQGPAIALAVFSLVWLLAASWAGFHREEHQTQEISQIREVGENQGRDIASIREMIVATLPGSVAHFVMEYFKLGNKIGKFMEIEEHRILAEGWQGIPKPPHTPQDAATKWQLVENFERERKKTLDRFCSVFQPDIEGLVQKTKDAGYSFRELDELLKPPRDDVEISTTRVLLERSADKIARHHKL